MASRALLLLWIQSSRWNHPLHRIWNFRHVVILCAITTVYNSSLYQSHTERGRWPIVAVKAVSSPNQHRNYPFRMPPLPSSAASGGGPFLSPHHQRSPVANSSQHQPNDTNIKTTTISSQCACGSLRIDIPIRYGGDHPTQLVDCHCPACRRYHVSGLVRYLHASDVIGMGDTAVRFRDSCDALGSVDRTYCGKCHSKLLTTTTTSDESTGIYVNMGPIDDTTVPDDLAEYWKQAPVTQWNAHAAASWATVQPGFTRPLPPSRSSGGCTCGACTYDYRLDAPMEIQHCYCYLCRQLSGGLFMSWVPIKVVPQKFHWKILEPAVPDDSGIVSRARQHGPETHRYTPLGERHSCSACGSTLSILYDYEDTNNARATIWLAAGGFDSIRFPFRIEPYVNRAVHICCLFRPKWFELPDDGLEQIEDAA